MQSIIPFPWFIFKDNTGVDNFRRLLSLTFWQALLSYRGALPVLRVRFWLNCFYAKSFFLSIIKQIQTKTRQRNSYIRQRAGYACESFFYKPLAAAQEHNTQNTFLTRFKIMSLPSFLLVQPELPDLMKQAPTTKGQCVTTWISIT